ncbi:uncharacterized protein LOC130561239, partial [Triplophysa rosa]|uniref:uncharacterized protein LOC130561239 n=1 Tax=Triplophysa rosa TaxID=992332 RepID=UPI002545BE23
HGNFSLLLENVTVKDEGEYTCQVNSEQRSVFSFSLNLKCIDDLSDSKFIVVYSCDVVVPLGSSVVLPCLTKKEPLPPEGLKVEWKRSGLESPVFVYEDGAEVQNEDYRDRAHFYTDDMKHENFSLLLKNLRKEDEGIYTCNVYRGTVFSRFVHSNLVQRLRDSGFRLQMFLAICPNIIMCFAFVFWGVSEGSVSETVCCCALYILRPLLLLWTAPYINDFKDRNKTLILKYSYVTDYFVLTAVVYPALFTNTWQKIQNFAEFDRVLVLILYGIIFVCCSCKAVYILEAEFGNRSKKVVKIFDIVADFTFEILPTLQFILLFYTFASARGGIIIVAVLPLLLTMTNERMFRKCYLHFGWSNEFIATVMLIVTLVMNAVMIGFFIFTMENKTDPVGWACVMVFLQILWSVVRFSDQSYYLRLDLGFHRFVSLYVFGSVIVVLICAVALMAELILKTINGERAVMDLRFIVFPSESLFIMSVLISGQFSSKIQACLKSCQMRMSSMQTPANRSQQNPNQHSSSLLQMTTLEEPREPIHQDEHGAPPFAEIPGLPWCACGNCREMPTDLERKCCGKEPAHCVSLLPDFSRYCLDEGIIHSQDMTEFGHIREPGDDNRENRYGAY